MQTTPPTSSGFSLRQFANQTLGSMLDFRGIGKEGYLRGDKSIWLLYALLVVISFVVYTSAATHEAFEFLRRGGWLHPFVKQIILLLLGIGLAYGFSIAPSSWVRNKMVLYSLITIAMFIALPFFGAEINKATRWIRVPIVGITLQPSEFFNLCLISWGALAGMYAHKTRERAGKYFGYYWAAVVLPIVVVTTSNFSTGILMALFVFLFSWVMKAPKKMLGYAALAGAILGVLFVIALIVTPASTLQDIHPRSVTWKSRITNIFQDPEHSDEYFKITDDKLQEQFGEIALANSELIGKGPGRSVAKQRLPAAHSDFIYAVIIEEYGILGMLVIPALYIWWFLLAARMAIREKQIYRKYLLMGIALLFPLQALINIAVVSGAFMTGQPLPLISAGGSSVFVCSMAFGLMLNISNTQKEIALLEQEAQNKGITLEDTTSQAKL